MLSRLLIAVTLMSVAFGANADYRSDCTSRYAKSGAIQGSKSCPVDAASNSPGGLGGYACLNDIDLIKQWCAGETDPQPEKSCPVADPVYPGSGAVTLSSTDFVSGDDMPMVFSRTYRSSSLRASTNAMGPVWFHSWQRQLNLAGANNGGSSKVVAYRESGEPVTFNWSSGYWRTAGFTGLALTQNGSGWALINLSSDTTETYSSQGVLLSERTRTGFVRTLTYDGSGRLTAISQHGDDAIAKFDLTLRLGYDDKGRLVRLTDPANGLTQYGYDTNSNLVSVTWPDGNVRRYVYDDVRFKNALTGEIDETGNRIATWTYDSQGRASAVSHPDSSRNVQFAYADGTTTISYGQSSLAMNFASIGGMLRPTTTGSAKGAAGTTWDAAGNLSSQTGVSGSSAQYVYDDTGRPVRAVVRSPLMGTSVTSVRYADATSLRPSTIASPGRMRAFVYDANGNVTGLSEFGTSDSTGENGFNAVASGQQQTIGVRYDALNRVAGAKVYVNGVMMEDCVYFYDSTGNRETAQNLVTGWLFFGDTERDAAHRVTRQNGNYREARIAYDARGRIARFTYNEGDERDGWISPPADRELRLFG
jgi:YD repeat-containing protein